MSPPEAPPIAPDAFQPAQAKLADFGGLGVDTASPLGASQAYRGLPPEYMKGDKLGKPSDVYGAPPSIAPHFIARGSTRRARAHFLKPVRAPC